MERNVKNRKKAESKEIARGLGEKEKSWCWCSENGEFIGYTGIHLAVRR